MNNNTPLRSIKLFCINCVGTIREVKKCSSNKCELFFYKEGKNPHRKGIGNRRPNITNLNINKKSKKSFEYAKYLLY